MAAVILFLVPMFHGVVFAGLALWFAKTKQPERQSHQKLAAVFSGAGALANIILCIMLIEILSGLTIITSSGVHHERHFGEYMPVILATQILFIAILFPSTQLILKHQD